MSASRRFLPLLLGVGALALVGFVVLASAVGNRGGATAGLTPEQARGQSLFRVRCASCHASTSEMGIGPGLAGLFEPGGPALPSGVDYGGKLPNGEPISDVTVGAFILNGGKGQIGNMPAVQLTKDELSAVIAYLRTLE